MITSDELADKIKNGGAPRVQLKCDKLDINEERFIVEGDIGLTAGGVATYAVERVELATRLAGGSQEQRQGLLGMERDGKTLRWARGRELTYCVWRETFDSDEEHQKVIDGMRDATEGWENICGIKFKHDTSFDHVDSLRFGNVDFPVLRQDGGGNTIAMAFFPDDVVRDRIVWVFDGYFGSSSGFDPVGVMRHELGHVLGFRHEHIRPEAPDLFNPESLEHTVEITAYDSTSVMHYVSGNVGDPELKFTDKDREGARQVYGGPDKEYSFAK